MMYIALSRDNPLSLTRQIYGYIRENILNGTLSENEKLPSTRELAKYLSIARNVVIESYEQLIAEGYIYTKNGSGTYISPGISFKEIIPWNDDHKSNAISIQQPSEVISFQLV